VKIGRVNSEKKTTRRSGFSVAWISPQMSFVVVVVVVVVMMGFLNIVQVA